MANFEYETCCVSSKAIDIEEMMQRALEISYSTFIKHVSLVKLNDQFGYGRGQGLCLKDDWHISYYKSRFKGRKCYVMKHSAIEYIFTEKR